MTLKAIKKQDPDTEEEGILLFEGKKYAVGLTWLTAEEDSDLKLVKTRAKKTQADFYCHRNTIAFQHGFGFLSKGHRLGMTAAAAVAADALVGEWHGVFAADNGWWYIAVHADNIAPEGDLFFHSEEEAYSFFTAQAQSYKWPRSYAPEAWNIPDIESEVSLEKIFQDADYAGRLQASNLDGLFGGKQAKNLAFFIVSLVMISGFLLISLPKLFPESVNKKIQITHSVIEAPDIIVAPPPIFIEDVTTEGGIASLRIPKPAEVIGFCLQGIEKIFRPFPGWKIGTVNCSLGGSTAQITGSWSQGPGGSLETLRGHVANLPDNISLRFDGSGQLSGSTSLGNFVRISQSVDPISRSDSIRLIYKRFRKLGSLQVQDIVPPPPQQKKGLQGAIEEPELQRPPYLQISLTTKTPPNILMPYFDLPGLRMQNISWSLASKTWSYTAWVWFDSQLFRQYYGVREKG